MKKVMYLLILLVPLQIRAISASSYIVMDQNSSRVLEGKNIDNKSLIASTTKIMTCIIALEHGDFDTPVKVDESILSAYGSGIYIEIGEELTLDDLLYGLMLRSGNDAALQIAKSVAGSVESFVYLMNEKASALGMTNTTFVNPSGLEENDNQANISTVYDMALLTRYANSNEHYRQIVSTKEITVKSSLKTYKWTNKNKLLHSFAYCTGGKTGFTKKARRTLVTTATKDDMKLIVVTFNDGNDFKDHQDLYEKYFTNYETKKVLNKDDSYGDNIYLNNDFYLVSKDGDEIGTNVKMDKIDHPYNGQIVGRVEVSLNDEVIGYRYLYYKKEIITENKSFISHLLNILKGRL